MFEAWCLVGVWGGKIGRICLVDQKNKMGSKQVCMRVAEADTLIEHKLSRNMVKSSVKYLHF